MSQSESLTRPIIGIEDRTAQEVFDIMCDRIAAWNRRPSTADRGGEVEAIVSDAFREFCVRDWNKPSWWGSEDTERFVARLSARIRSALATTAGESPASGNGG